MPVKTTQVSGSLAKLIGDKGRKAHEAHKDDPVSYGFANLPAGINGGVAQLVMAKWGTYKDDAKLAGKPFVTLQAIVKKPVEHKGSVVEGMRASITLPLCDTPDKSQDPAKNTFDYHYANFLNELKKLGVKTEEIGFDDIEAILQSLQEMKPYTRFSTRGWTPPKKKPTDPEPTEMVFTQFDGVCQFSENGDATALAVQDNTKLASTSADDYAAAEAADDQGGGDAEATATGAEEPSEDLDDLVATADGSGEAAEAAQTRMYEIAESVGYTRDEAEAAPDWASLAVMIREKQSEGGEAEAAEEPAEEAFEPKKNEVYKFKVPVLNSKTKKFAPGKAVKCQVLTVDTKTSKVTLKNLETGKTVMDSTGKKALQVGYDDLESGE